MDREPEMVRVGLAQINPTVGDLDGNTRRIIAAMRQADAVGCHIVAFPQLAISGTPLEDLPLKPAFPRDNRRRLEAVAEAQADLRCVAVVGFLDGDDALYNAAAVIQNGRVVGINRVPYGRGVTPPCDADLSPLFHFGDVRVRLIIGDAPSCHAPDAADIVLALGASPYFMEAGPIRERTLAACAAARAAFVCAVEPVGGQDAILFEGRSLVCSPSGDLLARGSSFEEALVVADLDLADVARIRRARSLSCPPRGVVEGSSVSLSALLARDQTARGGGSQGLTVEENLRAASPEPPAAVYEALTLAVRDYARKNGFTDVTLGLSGGIDSALVAAIAADALGPEHVIGVTMPSRYSSDETKSDAALLAENLGIRFMAAPIEAPFQASLEALAGAMAGAEPGVAEENLQARIRGNYLMTLSNAFGWLVLTTGNKSETAVGYTTLYGDMAGGFAVLQDVPKTLVYALSEYRNTLGLVIPESTITRPPSAELRPDQKDSDSLPPYSTLDGILSLYIEGGRSLEEIVRAGYDKALVHRVIRLVDRNEYKRRQGPPGPKITSRALGADRRLPLTNRYDEGG